MVSYGLNIVGLKEIDNLLRVQVPNSVRPAILRQVIRKPALKAVQEARRLQPIGDTGQMARTIGILRIKDQKQEFLEVAYKGRSLGHIYTYAPFISRRKRGVIKGHPWLFKRAGDNIANTAIVDMKRDVTGIMVGALKRSGYFR